MKTLKDILTDLVFVLVGLLIAYFIFIGKAEANDDKELADWMFYQTQVLVLADWATTRYCAKQMDNCYEANPVTAAVVGKEIDTAKLDIWMGTVLIMNWWMQDQFTSQKHRIWYNSVHFGLRFWAVQNNISVGAKIRF